MAADKPLVGIIMGSKSDWETMKNAADMLATLGIAHEVRIISAHRTPDLLDEWVASCEERGVKVIIAGAGLAAHLPGVTAAKTQIPVLGVPLKGGAMDGIDALMSIVQMPAGIPVGTLALGRTGAKNAALFAAAILQHSEPAVGEALRKFRADQTAAGVANSTVD